MNSSLNQHNGVYLMILMYEVEMTARGSRKPPV